MTYLAQAATIGGVWVALGGAALAVRRGRVVGASAALWAALVWLPVMFAVFLPRVW